MKVAIIGSGVGGMSTAIRLAKLGLEVTVFEANAFSGGKINELRLGGYRFDRGPSVFTEPELLDELVDLVGDNKITFDYQYLAESCRYFFSDGQLVVLPSGREKVAQTMSAELGEQGKKVDEFLRKMEQNYKAVYPVFIAASLHRTSHWLNKHVPHALSRLTKYGLLKSMNAVNENQFKNPKTVQIFNRLATYNGSDPYQTPGMLNIISHLEMNQGPALPKGGMVSISHTLRKLAEAEGVKVRVSEKVEEILLENKRVSGIRTNKAHFFPADIVVSNMDVHFTYEKLLPNVSQPKENLNQEKSSSAIVFYWGIKSVFPSLGVHNIFFSNDYKAEFEHIFASKTMSGDATIYVHITSKVESDDAPPNGENWFVMVNAPINTGQNWDEIIQKTKSSILRKLSESLEQDIAELIEEESIMDPRNLEGMYFGKQGSIYGNASNNRMAAFYRHPNFSKEIKGLYFAGVTVHPGGGIPLALNSAKIVEKCVKEDFFK
jgi:phytoene desaturase